MANEENAWMSSVALVDRCEAIDIIYYFYPAGSRRVDLLSDIVDFGACALASIGSYRSISDMTV